MNENKTNQVAYSPEETYNRDASPQYSYPSEDIASDIYGFTGCMDELDSDCLRLIGCAALL